MNDKTSSPLGAISYGQLRIFLRAGERPKPVTWRDWLNNRPTYFRILDAARQFGITYGAVRHCSSGFMAKGQVEHDHFESGNSRLPLYVELLGPKGKLQEFCQANEQALHGRLMVYKDIEQWGWEDESAKPPGAASS